MLEMCTQEPVCGYLYYNISNAFQLIFKDCMLKWLLNKNNVNDPSPPNIHNFTFVISFHVKCEQNWNFRLSNKLRLLSTQSTCINWNIFCLHFLMKIRMRWLLVIKDNVLLEEDLFSRTFEETPRSRQFYGT